MRTWSIFTHENPASARSSLLAVVMAVMLLVSSAPAGQAEADDRPNMLIIMADDLGFSDIGAFGGEIPTPHLDRLADQGRRFSNFHVSASCSPTRAMLMSGLPPHLAGVGTVPEIASARQREHAGYAGRLDPEIETVADRLKALGYVTYHAGKWHLGETTDADPARRGFDRSIALLSGAASHFGDQLGSSPRAPVAPYTEDGKPISLPEDFYSSDDFTDRMIEYIQSDRAEGEPYFGYLAYSAPHFPLQAPDEWLDRFSGQYDAGYLPVAEGRLARARAEGVVRTEATLDLEARLTSNWETLSSTERKHAARRMEIYAAMVANLDWNVGRLLAAIEDSGEADNTLIIFLSDNGPDFSYAETAPFRADWVGQTFDNSFANWGRPGSFISYGQAWAEVGATPYRLFKGTMAEGGVRSPAIITWRGRIEGGEVSDMFLTAMDVAPTLIDIAGGEYDLAPHGGVSFAAHLEDIAAEVHDADYVVAGESLSTKALFRGPWKLLFLPPPLGDGEWHLYNIKLDPFETTDLSSEAPEVKADLLRAFETYAQETGLVASDEDLLERLMGAKPDAH